jgi:hypothetical protein
MTPQEKGKALEKYVEGLLSHVYRTWITNGSGNVSDDADVKSGPFLIECKYRDRPNTVINAGVWKKLTGQAWRQRKQPLLVLQNSEDKRFAVVEFDLLVEILENSTWEPMP